MMAIALGVLVLTALVTAGLARRSEADTARHDVRDRAEVVAPEFDQLIRQLPNAQAATGTVAGRRQVRRIRDLVNTTLRASNGAVVAVDANGDVQEVLGRLLGTAGATPTLPAGVTTLSHARSVRSRVLPMIRMRAPDETRPRLDPWSDGVARRTTVFLVRADPA